MARLFRLRIVVHKGAIPVVLVWADLETAEKNGGTTRTSFSGDQNLEAS